MSQFDTVQQAVSFKTRLAFLPLHVLPEGLTRFLESVPRLLPSPQNFQPSIHKRRPQFAAVRGEATNKIENSDEVAEISARNG